MNRLIRNINGQLLDETYKSFESKEYTLDIFFDPSTVFDIAYYSSIPS